MYKLFFTLKEFDEIGLHKCNLYAVQVVCEKTQQSLFKYYIQTSILYEFS